ncbi:MAG TPA: hypothetical protein VMF89_34530 [Polyangiales bacterium]|nr:hypothetical protein [Polyangiales bacterium]
MLSVLAFARVASASDPQAFDYHGWHVDASQVTGQPLDAVTRIVRKQIDGIETLGMAQDIVSFMRTVPLHAEAPRDGAPAHYDRTHGIHFSVDALEGNEPVLLNALLLAFQEQKLKSEDSTVIANAYKAARDSGAWPASAPMMKSPQDFFAATATVYLFGDLDTAPFSRGRLNAAQPEYWKWLGGVFDGFHGCEGVQ